MATIDGHTKEVWRPAIECRGRDRATIRRPCGGALELEQIDHDPRVRAVGLHLIQDDLSVSTGP